MNLYNNRPNFLDYTKTIGIWLVILGHFVYYFQLPFSSTPIWWLCHSITLFHMPLFFIVSGILMKDASAKVITVKILKRLLIPYVIIVSICFFLGFSIRLIVDDESVNCNMIKQQLIGVLTASDFKYHDNFSGAMWFCVALAWIQFFFAVTNRYLRLCAIMGGVILMYIGNILPLRFDSALVGFIFFMMGFYAKTYFYLLPKMQPRIQIFLLVISAVLLIISTYFILDYNNRQCLSINAMFFGRYPLLFLVSGFFGTVIVMLISCMLEKRKLYDSFVLAVSTGTIIILGFHKIVAIIMKHFITTYTIPIALIYSVICMSVCYVIIIIAKKHFPIILGGR